MRRPAGDRDARRYRTFDAARTHHGIDFGEKFEPALAKSDLARAQDDANCRQRRRRSRRATSEFTRLVKSISTAWCVRHLADSAGSATERVDATPGAKVVGMPRF